ncbi:MAG: glycosyltransferase family 2 protein, partial [Vulcanimicrobiota bacterium]
MEKIPEVSVILCTYNSATFLPGAVDSVLTQTFTDFELIIVDDGSTDNTEKIVGEYDDSRVVYLKLEKNAGLPAARNRGIEIARGKYIAYQDSDDLWMPEKLERQYKALEEADEDVGVVYSAWWQVRDGEKYRFPTGNEKLEGYLYHRFLFGNIFTVHVLMKKEVFDKVGFFDEELPAFEDWEL